VSDDQIPPGDVDEGEPRESLTRRLMDMGADVVNKALVTGVGAVFMTEEGIRNAVTDLRLPKDVAKSLVTQAEITKKEMFRIIGREVRTFLEQSNISQAIAGALADTTVEITTTIRFRPNEEGGVTPEVTSRASELRRSDDAPSQDVDAATVSGDPPDSADAEDAET
jgi:hypothetical protein